jgi:uncharacterized protein (TIRG00374 family)
MARRDIETDIVKEEIEPMTSTAANQEQSLWRRILRNRWAFRLIGVAIFVLILTRIDLMEAFETLKSVNLFFVLLSLLIQMVALFVATVRWHLIMRYLQILIPLRRTFVHQLVGTAAALVTPGQLGEFVKVLYHRQEGYPLPESFLSVVIDRAYDLLMLLLFGFISLSLLFGLSPQLTTILSIAAVVGAIVIFLFFRRREQSAQFIAKLLRRMSPKDYKDVVEENALRLAYKVAGFDWRLLTIAGVITVANYVLLLMRVYAIVLALSIRVPIIDFVMIVPLLRLVGLVPVSVLGLGTRDLTSIYLFGRLGVPETKGLLVSNLGLITIIIQALIGLLVWWRFPLRVPTGERGSAPTQPAETN